jgi:enoyl-CoA hydratase
MALGGGVELILCCDMVVASRTATFGLPEVKRGLMPDFGGVFRISRFLPINIAREMLLTGEPLSAERAERLGFINHIVEPGHALAEALTLAEKICTNAPLAVREALGVFNQKVNGEESEIWRFSNVAHERLLKTDDIKEGIGAFFERRSPKWLGK